MDTLFVGVHGTFDFIFNFIFYRPCYNLSLSFSPVENRKKTRIHVIIDIQKSNVKYSSTLSRKEKDHVTKNLSTYILKIIHDLK